MSKNNEIKHCYVSDDLKTFQRKLVLVDDNMLILGVFDTLEDAEEYIKMLNN